MKQFVGASFKSASLGGGDYRAVLNQAKSFNPDLFVWAGYDADAIPIVAQAKEVNFTEVVRRSLRAGLQIMERTSS